MAGGDNMLVPDLVQPSAPAEVDPLVDMLGSAADAPPPVKEPMGSDPAGDKDLEDLLGSATDAPPPKESNKPEPSNPAEDDDLAGLF